MQDVPSCYCCCWTAWYKEFIFFPNGLQISLSRKFHPQMLLLLITIAPSLHLQPKKITACFTFQFFFSFCFISSLVWQRNMKIVSCVLIISLCFVFPDLFKFSSLARLLFDKDVLFSSLIFQEHSLLKMIILQLDRLASPLRPSSHRRMMRPLLKKLYDEQTPKWEGWETGKKEKERGRHCCKYVCVGCSMYIHDNVDAPM